MIFRDILGLLGNICVFLSSFAHRKQLGVDSICFCALSLSKLSFHVGLTLKWIFSVDTIFLFHAPIKIDEISTGQAVPHDLFERCSRIFCEAGKGHFRFGFYSCYSYCYTKGTKKLYDNLRRTVSYGKARASIVAERSEPRYPFGKRTLDLNLVGPKTPNINSDFVMIFSILLLLAGFLIRFAHHLMVHII